MAFQESGSLNNYAAFQRCSVSIKQEIKTSAYTAVKSLLGASLMLSTHVAVSNICLQPILVLN